MLNGLEKLHLIEARLSLGDYYKMAQNTYLQTLKGVTPLLLHSTNYVARPLHGIELSK
jgi:hypothetical protein